MTVVEYLVNLDEAKRLIAQHIVRRTARRIAQLELTLDGERVVVKGVAPNFYIKQLAIQAVQELQASETWSGPIDLEVEVSDPERDDAWLSRGSPELAASSDDWEERLDEVRDRERCDFVGRGTVGPLLRSLVVRWLPAAQ